MKRKYRLLKQWILVLTKGTRKANLMIVGAQKSGTTSLHNYLNQLPRFYGSSPKELHYFDREDNYTKGEKWYNRHFIDRGEGYYYETSPSYLARDFVPQRIYDYNPQIKIIIILRNPVSRAYSAWNMYRDWSDKGVIPLSIKNDQDGERESPIYKVFFKHGCPTFSEYLKYEMSLILKNDPDEEPSIIRRGIYYPQIKRYIDVFGHENVLILGFNHFNKKPDEVLHKIAEFVSEKKFVLTSGTKIKKEIKNKRAYTLGIEEEETKKLESFYAEHNTMLFNYLGYRVDW